MSRPTEKAKRDARFVPFNRPAISGAEQSYLDEVMKSGKFGGGGPFTRRCNAWLREHFAVPAVLTTTSCTHALEMAALLCELKPGDEVILPSYAFSSTAAAFARCGAALVFVDIEPSTMNIDPRAVESAISSKTRVVVALHYAGVACNMDVLGELAREHSLLLVEDAAQAFLAQYRGARCGTLGTFGCLSFHETKNIHCGEGGALIVNDARYVARAETILEKGTDRMRYFRGEVDRYTWRDLGSSYVPSELNSAFLLAQLEHGEEITRNRVESWQAYLDHLHPLAEAGLIELPVIPEGCRHNGHMFWIKTRGVEERDALIRFLRDRAVHSVFHYVPLHSAPAGRRYGRFVGRDRHTTQEAGRLLRLPLSYRFSHTARVAQAVKAFYDDV